MKRGRFYATGFLLFSVALMTGLGVWNFVQSRQHALSSHHQWVERVSTRILAERLSKGHALENLQDLDRDEIRRALFPRPDFAGAYWFDVRTHEFERWVTPAFVRLLTSPDPRLVVSQLQATEARTIQLG